MACILAARRHVGASLARDADDSLSQLCVTPDGPSLMPPSPAYPTPQALGGADGTAI